MSVMEIDSLAGHVRRLEASNEELGLKLHHAELENSALHAALAAKGARADQIHTYEMPMSDEPWPCAICGGDPDARIHG